MTRYRIAIGELLSMRKAPCGYAAVTLCAGSLRIISLIDRSIGYTLGTISHETFDRNNQGYEMQSNLLLTDSSLIESSTIVHWPGAEIGSLVKWK